MTAICFICDERVFNKEKYPDYDYDSLYFYLDGMPIIKTSYDEWKEIVGGNKNLFLRELLSGKKLA
jgi:hypothetical protein